jgi:MFS family permease
MLVKPIVFEFVLFGALGLLPTFVVSRGFSTQTAVNVLATLSAGSAFGRYLAGLLSDTFGRYNSMTLTLLFSLLTVFAFWLPLGSTTPSNGTPSAVLLYIFAPLFGFGSGSVISLAPGS